MKWQELADNSCPIVRSLAIFGDHWTLLMFRNAVLRTRRFEDVQEQLGITHHLLPERLGRLVEQQILKKVIYQESPKRYAYRLTERGLALYPILLTISDWSTHWMNDGNYASFQYVHKPCGHHTRIVLQCTACNQPLHAHDMCASFKNSLPENRAVKNQSA